MDGMSGFEMSPIEKFMTGGGFMTLFVIVFVVILGIILTVLISGITQWNKNNHSPKLIVPAKVTSKRIDVSRSHHDSNGDGISDHHSSSTWYYITFEFETKDRMEFAVRGEEYGLLAEGDQGKLTFQGTRYLGFQILHE